MQRGMVDITKIIVLNPTNPELCNLLKERIATLKKAVTPCGAVGNKARLMDDIDKIAFEIMDRLLMKTGESDED